MMETPELKNKIILAGEISPNTVVERASMPNHQLVKTDLPPQQEGKLVFRSVIKKDGKWETQEGDVLIEPSKQMVVIGSIDEKSQF